LKVRLLSIFWLILHIATRPLARSDAILLFVCSRNTFLKHLAELVGLHWFWTWWQPAHNNIVVDRFSKSWPADADDLFFKRAMAGVVGADVQIFASRLPYPSSLLSLVIERGPHLHNVNGENTGEKGTQYWRRRLPRATARRPEARQPISHWCTAGLSRQGSAGASCRFAWFVADLPETYWKPWCVRPWLESKRVISNLPWLCLVIPWGFRNLRSTRTMAAQVPWSLWDIPCALRPRLCELHGTFGNFHGTTVHGFTYSMVK